MLELIILHPQLLNRIGRSLAFCVACQPRFARIQELFAPLVVQAFADPLTLAQLCYCAFTAQSLQDAPDLVLIGIACASFAANIAHALRDGGRAVCCCFFLPNFLAMVILQS